MPRRMVLDRLTANFADSLALIGAINLLNQIKNEITDT
jgi:hypothetical protein